MPRYYPTFPRRLDSLSTRSSIPSPSELWLALSIVERLGRPRLATQPQPTRPIGTQCTQALGTLSLVIKVSFSRCLRVTSSPSRVYAYAAAVDCFTAVPYFLCLLRARPPLGSTTLYYIQESMLTWTPATRTHLRVVLSSRKRSFDALSFATCLLSLATLPVFFSRDDGSEIKEPQALLLGGYQDFAF
ncbi:hypothetical protein ONZ45_g6865 [Pleurotus djamor]|nr:hypothetical protein ONZ45_g6865 [Pleurotus djamor]